MRVERIDRPGALYDASVAARTFEGVNGICEAKIGFDAMVAEMVAYPIDKVPELGRSGGLFAYTGFCGF